MLNGGFLVAVLAGLALLALGVLGAVLHLAARRPSSRSHGAVHRHLHVEAVRRSFRQAVATIERNIASRAERHAVPWIMVLDESDDLRPLPVAQSGVSQTWGSEAASAASVQGMTWNFFDRAVVVDIKGPYLGAPDGGSADAPWDEFLDLCRDYRPHRPFDSVVLTLPASLLSDDSAEGRLALAQRARQTHRRLWLAQNRFAMRLVVYVTVTEAERLPGFGDFARALPEPLRASMLGWSSPYELNASFQSTWVEEAIGSMLQTVSDTSIELLVKRATPQSAGAWLLLPARIQDMQSQLQRYVDEIMRPNAYHEPFFLRGIYLVGDMGGRSEPGADVGLLDTAPDDEGDLHAPESRSPCQPVFLRDLFEKKIFIEHGLTRVSSQRHPARPLRHRVARWGAIAVLGGWSIGLLVATASMHRRNTELVARLSQLDVDARTRAHAIDRAEALPSTWYRERALALLSMGDGLRRATRGSVFMPGSWGIFDSLEARVTDRIGHAFGEIAVTTLHQELTTRATQLTGARQTALPGEPEAGDLCGPPRSFIGLDDAARVDSLAPEALPEFAALQRYVVEVDELDATLLAMERLRGGGDIEDLRSVVRYGLGAELPRDMDASLRWFRQAALDSATPSDIALRRLRHAVRCAFDKGAARLARRIFAGNALLLNEIRLARHGTRTTDGFETRSLDPSIQVWRELAATLKDQENLVASGTGGWMCRSTLDLGPAWDRLLAQIARTRLMGTEVADALRERTRADFQRARADFDVTCGGMHSGIVWLDKEKRFALSPERAALRNALTGLMAQPFITAPVASELATLPTQVFAAWDQGRLDQALEVADLRKRFMTESLAAFPAAWRPDIQATLDAHFARMVMALLSGARGIDKAGGGAGAETLFDASRQRLSKVAALLAELGAAQRADGLRELVSHEALARLRQVDDDLTRSELYALGEFDIAAGRDTRGPVLTALGVGDASGLIAYLGQQAGRVETLGRQAEVYLAALDAADAASALARRWQEIVRDLERYRLKNPNSSLLQLEQHLLGLGSEVDSSGCIDKLRGFSALARGDYFAERHAHIAQALRARCGELQARDRQAQWQRFAVRFNQLLAGRYPFAPAPLRDTAMAEATDVGEMLRAFEGMQRASAPAAKPSVLTTPSPPTNPVASSFGEQFERTREFLAPLFPAEEGATPGYDVAVDFRVNTANEIEGHQIIDWSIDIGEQTLHQRDTPRTLRWDYGMPIAIALRLAKDSPLTAVTDAQQSALTTDGRTVVFRFSDPWALINLMQRQRDAEPATRSEGRSSLLRLEFPVRTQPAVGALPPPQGDRARVYLRLTVMPAGRKTPVRWPGAFPMRAPDGWSALS